jgi:lipoprotein-anchoring transpeptidase ErfK/SrfK
MRRVVVLAVAAGALGAPVAAHAGTTREVRLSDEHTYTRTAEVRRPAMIRRSPYPRSEAIGRLRTWTEDRYPEVYLLLRKRIRPAGPSWIRIRVPGRPNGRTGWVRADALRPARLTRLALVLDRRRLTVKLLRRGRLVWRGPVGIGAPGMATPRGRFWIREKLPGGGGIYGPWAFGTSAYSALSDWPGGGVIGIHGTNQPWLIGSAVSHGCIRMRNADVLRLRHWAKPGTRLRIHA